MASNSNSQYLIGDANTAQTLTTSYALSTAATQRYLDISGSEQLILVATYTPGSNNRTLTFKVEFSYDGGTTWGSETIGSDSAVASNVVTTSVYERQYSMAGTASGTTYVYRVPILVSDNGPKGCLVRVQVKEDAAAHGTVKILATTYIPN